MEPFWPLGMMPTEPNYPYYRKTPQDLNAQANSRLSASGWTPHSFGPEQQWRHGPDGGIMEIRKEKSRDAARSRRGKENFEFYELAKMLPLPTAITTQLDKASIIRLTISYLKLKDFTGHGDPPWSQHGAKHLKGGLRHRTAQDLTLEIFDQHQGTHILQSLDGFAFSLAADGRFLYISETVSIYLGLSQVEMTGSSVFDYIHAEDHQEMADQLGVTLTMGQCLPSPSSLGSDDASMPSPGTTMNPDVASGMTISPTTPFKGYERAFCIRMKSTLTKRGCHFKSSGYRVLLMLGHLRPQCMMSHTRKSEVGLMGFVCLAIALPPPSVHEVRLESDMFVTRLNFDFRIAHCEPKASDLLDYTAEELQGRSLYSLCHAQDTEKLKKSHQDLMKKGQVMSPYFRILNKRGGYTWMQLCATVICNSKSGEEQNIICVNYIISRCEYESMILDEAQLDPTLINMKPDSMDYTSRDTPDPTGDMSRGVRGEDTGVCSPAGTANGVQPMCDNESPQSSAILEPSATPHRSSPEAPPEGAQIKTEVSGNVLTRAASSEPMDEVSAVGRSSPGGRMPASRSSTPTTPQMRPSSCKTLPSLVPSASLDGSGGLRSEEGSVRELEAAMTRHLPEESADFSTDSLLRGSSGCAASGSRPTIQWVGGAGSQQSALPASTLLRQLYANRESVIRTSAPRSYYPEVQSTLPTPPGHDGYQGHDFANYNHGSVSNGIGMPAAYPDYHSAMTPPSSVSPREKMAGECSELRPPATSYLSDLSGGMPAQPVPLKPQVYSYGPSGLEAPPYGTSLVDQTNSLYPSSSFHLYSSNSNKPAGAYDTLRSGSSWYSSSS